jgi:hypothetical protein
MAAGTGASNLGYGNTSPFSYVNGKFVNLDSSNSPATFGSNEVSGCPGLVGTKNNVDAAAGVYPGSSILFKGGAKKLKKKIKNITKQYKMKGRSRNSLRKKLRSRYASRTLARAGGKKTRRNKRYSRRQRGGYAQYQNNLPFTPTYQVAGVNLPANHLALANPPPIKMLPNCTNCVDNLNMYTMKGFPSKGH